MNDQEIEKRLDDIMSEPYVIRQEPGAWCVFERIPNLLSPFPGERLVRSFPTKESALAAVKIFIRPEVIRIDANGNPIEPAL